MPEFILNVNDYRAFEKLDGFTRGYIEALFFTESSPAFTSDEWHSDECQEALREGTSDGQLPGDSGFDDIDDESLARIIAECAAFQHENAALLRDAYDRDFEQEQAGRDFWFTRNGHGVGYWDRGILNTDDLGEHLSTAAKRAGEVYTVEYTADGKVIVQ